MPRRAEGRLTGQPVTTEIPQPAGGVKLVTFIPWTLVKRGMKKEIITPIETPEAFTVEAAEERKQKTAEQPSPVVGRWVWRTTGSRCWMRGSLRP